MSLVSSIISVFESQILLNSVSVSIVLQINRDNRDKLKIIYLTSQQNIFCGPQEEPSLGGSNEGSQHMILRRNSENYP